MRVEICRRIEVVITGRTRNALALIGSWVRIPPSAPEKETVTISGCFLFLLKINYNNVTELQFC